VFAQLSNHIRVLPTHQDGFRYYTAAPRIGSCQGLIDERLRFLEKEI